MKKYEEKKLEELRALKKHKKQHEQEIQDDEEEMELEEMQHATVNQELLSDQQQENSIIPTWMKVSFEVLKFESFFEKAKDKDTFISNVINLFKDLVSGQFIKSFEETSNGFKALFNQGQNLNLDLKKQQITLKGFGLNDNPLDTAFSLLKSLGGYSVDISGMQNKQNRMNSWKKAAENNMEVKGLKPQEESAYMNYPRTPSRAL